MSSEQAKPNLLKLPIVLKNKLILKKGMKPLNRKVKFVKSFQNIVQEDVIYVSKPGDFTTGEARNMKIVNLLNVNTKSSMTVAKCQSHAGEVYEKTSEEITKLIGQNNYDILFSSLCSIISQELKIRSINSLLTVPKNTKTVQCQTDVYESVCVNKNVVEAFCQTNETCLEELKKFKTRKRNKRQQLAPYVVKDEPEVKVLKKVVIFPDNLDLVSDHKEESFAESTPEDSELPILRSAFDDEYDCNSRLSAISITTTPDLLLNPMKILNSVDKHTLPEVSTSEPYTLHNMDSSTNISQVNLNSPPELRQTNNQLQLREHLQKMPVEQRRKLLYYQFLNDCKSCLIPDNEGHLPIHVAVLSNDIHLLKRQCLVLKMRGASVDMKVEDLTPLRMSLFEENTEIMSVLLNHGADVLDSDEEDRTCFHLAAEINTDHLQILINHCQQNARKLLQENDWWQTEYEKKSDDELGQIMMTNVNKLYDTQGYTPLMLASKLGQYNNVKALLESCKNIVNIQMPNSGNTSLYVAVCAACLDAEGNGNKAKIIDNFRKTIELLIDYGADPYIGNFAGSSVNDLLTEFNIDELSMLVANRMTSVRCFAGQMPVGHNGTDYMLLKDDKGGVNLTKVKNNKPVPVILENIVVKTLAKGNNKAKVNNTTKVNNTATINTPVIVNNTSIVNSPSKVNNTVKINNIAKVMNTAKVNNSATGNNSDKINNLDKAKSPPFSYLPKLLPISPAVPDTANVARTGKVNIKESVNASQSYTPIVKSFKLNKPLYIKNTMTANTDTNKRKLELTQPTISKKLKNN